MDKNLEQLAELIGVDTESITMLLDMFFESLDEDVENIGQAIESGDLSEVHASAHKLKGLAANLRFEDLVEFCKRIEVGAKSGEALDYAEKYETLRKEAQSMKEWYKSVRV